MPEAHSSGENRYFDGGVPAEVYADFLPTRVYFAPRLGLVESGGDLGTAPGSGKVYFGQGNEAGGLGRSSI
jgi:hypothetical protein